MKILAIGAHLDDIELACGGTIARCVDSGCKVSMTVLSDSAYSLYNGKIVRSSKDAMSEGRKAARILGVKDFSVADFPAKDVPYDSGVVELLDKKINEIRPDIVFTHWPFDTHKSHQNTGLSSISAARYSNSILMYEPITPAGRSYVGFRPQCYIDITPYIDRKLKALMAHKTEYKKYGRNWLEGVKARAAYRGFEIGRKYAEAFEVMRFELKF